MLNKIKVLLYICFSVAILFFDINFVYKLVLGTALILFWGFVIIRVNCVKIVYLESIYFSCILVVQFTYQYIESNYFQMKNSILYSFFLSSFVSCYILCTTFIARTINDKIHIHASVRENQHK